MPPETTKGRPNPPDTPQPPAASAAAPAEPGTAVHPTQERVLTERDEAKVLELVAAGVSYRRIADLLKVSKSTVGRTVQRALREHYEDNWLNLRDFVARESVQLDRLVQAWLPRALQGDRDAAIIVLRTQTQRLRLAAAAGITAAQKIQVGGVGGSPVLDSEIAELLQKVAQNDTVRE